MTIPFLIRFIRVNSRLNAFGCAPSRCVCQSICGCRPGSQAAGPALCRSNKPSGLWLRPAGSALTRRQWNDLLKNGGRKPAVSQNLLQPLRESSWKFRRALPRVIVPGGLKIRIGAHPAADSAQSQMENLRVLNHLRNCAVTKSLSSNRSPDAGAFLETHEYKGSIVKSAQWTLWCFASGARPLMILLTRILKVTSVAGGSRTTHKGDTARSSGQKCVRRSFP